MKLFADSGAYSAWSRKTRIDINEYIEFIQKNKDYLETYACLDDIKDPDKTWKNQEIMEKAGLNPLPVYHVDEPDKYLDRAMSYDYFAVGGMALKGSVSRRNRFNYVFSKVCPKENNFFPIKKVHGFGLAAPDLLVDYPWYSSDTTTWVMYSRFGVILIPRMIDGSIRYDKPPHVIAISSRSGSIGKKSHYSQFGEDFEQPYYRDYCAKRGFPIGLTELKYVSSGYILQENEKWIDRKKKDRVEVIKEKGLCCDGEMRDQLNLQYFLDLEKYQKKWPWAWKHQDTPLFSDERK